MNDNVAASFTLSVLTVVAFAVLLYRPDPPPPATPPPEPTPVASAKTTENGVEIVEAHEPASVEPPPAPAPRVTVPVVPVVRRVAPAPAPPLPVATPRPAVTQRAVGAAPVAPPPSRPATKPKARRPVGPHGAFTRAERGETLAGVAERVYGGPEALDTLWKANRDLVDGPDVPLGEGMLLRTP